MMPLRQKQLKETLRGDRHENRLNFLLTCALCGAPHKDHARRKFVEAQKVQPKGKVSRADQALSLIRSLYAVEKKAQHVTAEERD